MQNNVISKANDEIVEKLFNEIQLIVNENKNKMIYQINNTLVDTFLPLVN